MMHEQTNPALHVAGVNVAEPMTGSSVRRPLPPVAAPAEVADAGLIRIGAGLGLPPKRG